MPWTYNEILQQTGKLAGEPAEASTAWVTFPSADRKFAVKVAENDILFKLAAPAIFSICPSMVKGPITPSISSNLLTVPEDYFKFYLLYRENSNGRHDYLKFLSKDREIVRDAYLLKSKYDPYCFPFGNGKLKMVHEFSGTPTYKFHYIHKPVTADRLFQFGDVETLFGGVEELICIRAAVYLLTFSSRGIKKNDLETQYNEQVASINASFMDGGKL